MVQELLFWNIIVIQFYIDTDVQPVFVFVLLLLTIGDKGSNNLVIQIILFMQIFHHLASSARDQIYKSWQETCQQYSTLQIADSYRGWYQRIYLLDQFSIIYTHIHSYTQKYIEKQNKQMAFVHRCVICPILKRVEKCLKFSLFPLFLNLPISQYQLLCIYHFYFPYFSKIHIFHKIPIIPVFHITIDFPIFQIIP